jgi:guanylate kinase
MTNIFIISAPSGSGKSTLVNEILFRVHGLEFSVSYTTRAPRGSEKSGREYYFVSREEFEKMKAEDEFLEYADVFGNYYGTSKSFLRDAQRNNEDLLLDIDVQGAEQIKKKLPEAVSVFILPPNRKELEARLRNRSLDTEEVIERRLATAAREIENYAKYDYILVNDRLEDSIELLRSILLAVRLQRSGKAISVEETEIVAKAESCRLQNVRERLQPILASFAPAGAGKKS